MTFLVPGRVIAGKYQLERPLGAGGMGAVWVARHLQLGMVVAVKCIDPVQAASADTRARFEREARASALMRSPHVVQVHDYGVEEGVPYLVMELLAGEDLGQRLKREKVLDLRAAAILFAQLGKGIHHAHEAGIIHRDLKPANVFLAQAHGDEAVKILDFGLAKSTSFGSADELTKEGSLLGTPHYMSPEQVRPTQPLDRRTDLWSLGVILFRCLTGRLPFPGDDLAHVLVGICADPLPRASQCAPGLGPQVDAFFDRALARPREARFQTALEMVQAFAAIAGLTEISGISPPATVRLPETSSAGPNHTMAISASSFVEVAPSGASSAAKSGTLAPAGRNVEAPAKSGGRVAVALAVALTAAAVVGGTALVLTRATPGAPATSDSMRAPAATGEPPARTETTSAGAPAPREEPPLVAPAVSVEPTASANPVASAEPAGSAGPAAAKPALKGRLPSGASTAKPGGAQQPSMFGF